MKRTRTIRRSNAGAAFADEMVLSVTAAGDLRVHARSWRQYKVE
jgi:hypothetical protein